MPTNTETVGFFSKTGTLTQPTRQTTANSTETGSSSGTTQTSESDVADAAAQQTAAAITEAAVFKVSNQLNVGNTGFDSGVASLVSSAIAAGLKNKPTASPAPERKEIGGTIQNEILAGGRQTTTPTPTTPSPVTSTPGTTTPSPTASIPGGENPTEIPRKAEGKKKDREPRRVVVNPDTGADPVRKGRKRFETSA